MNVGEVRGFNFEMVFDLNSTDPPLACLSEKAVFFHSCACGDVIALMYLSFRFTIVCAASFQDSHDFFFSIQTRKLCFMSR